MGGQYKPLTSAECQAIFDLALRLLSDLGMGEVPDRLADLLIAAGGQAAGDRVLLPEVLVRNAIATAPKVITLQGRDPARTIDVGGSSVHGGTGGAQVALHNAQRRL